MQKKSFLVYVALAFVWGVFLNYPLASVEASVAVMAPSPPEDNPHPPVTELEKKSVALTEVFMKSILSKTLPDLTKNYLVGGPDYSDKDSACLTDKNCWMKDAKFLNNLSRLFTHQGKATEWKHAHVIPWSLTKTKTPPPAATSDSIKTANEALAPPQLKQDEYMVHVYVRFDKSPDWYHLDLILTSDAGGNPALRYLFMVKMPAADNPSRPSLKPGMICQNALLVFPQA